MTQLALPTGVILATTSGSSVTSIGWIANPLGGDNNLAHAVDDIAGKTIIFNFPGDGTAYADVYFSITPLSAPVAGNHILRIDHRTDIDGDCYLYNRSNGSTVCIMGLDPGLGSINTQTHVLTSGEIAAILDYSNLGFHVYGADDSGGASGFANEVDYIQLVIPDAAPPVSSAPGSLGQFDGHMNYKNWF